MKIGIIGAGSIGKALAGHMASTGHEVLVSNSRGPESLSGLVAELGPRARAGTRQEAAATDLVMLSVPWEQVPEALSGLPAWKDRILVDATNPVLQPGFRLADLGGRTSSEVVASLAPGARVVKAANTLRAAVLAADPRQAGGRRVLFMSGDDEAAKAEVRGLFEKAGFATLDLGGLSMGGKLQQFPGGPLPVHNLIELD
ncbi:NADPH-dependent F420 reductase [Polyangium jinanense]|uniref:NAD(P)-binding domain-containing protein n=1 Tax=Polyangium jinanense TaxID=2829994 RepID=A0A9X3X609_9BACT|nr:NAD(P)-binding domain-containing protein [Polyangium jinanense]MDC3960087.1 NAD(P)-binding domain-containing protein [Polyangium jinanense]MDC3984404.1 NAD(P)-binding domain-containing protein [Polyangium jinanense]